MIWTLLKVRSYLKDAMNTKFIKPLFEHMYYLLFLKLKAL